MSFTYGMNLGKLRLPESPAEVKPLFLPDRERAYREIAGIALAGEVRTTDAFSLRSRREIATFFLPVIFQISCSGTREGPFSFAGFLFAQHGLRLRSGGWGSLLAHEPFQFFTRPDGAAGGKPGSLVYPALLYPPPERGYADTQIRRRALCP